MYLVNKYYISLVGSTSFAHNVYQLLSYHYGIKNMNKSIIPISQISIMLCCYFINFKETNRMLMRILSHRPLNNLFSFLIGL